MQEMSYMENPSAEHTHSRPHTLHHTTNTQEIKKELMERWNG
jgi:hypothetical protein